MIYYIYKITNTINGKIYIGLTRNTPMYRFKQHIGSPYMLGRAISKYGQSSFVVESIFETDDIDKAKWAERTLIEQWDANNRAIGYNLTRGGDAPPDDIKEKWQLWFDTNGPYRFSEEQRKHQSDVGYKHWESDKGQERKATMHKQSDEARSKNRSKAIGRKRKYLPDGSWIWSR